MHSKHASGNALFKANLKTRTSVPIVVPTADEKGVKYVDTTLKIPSAYNNAPQAIKLSSETSSKLTIPAAGFRYDNTK